MRLLPLVRSVVLVMAGLAVITILLMMMDRPSGMHPLLVVFVLIPVGLLLLGMVVMPARVSPVARLVASIAVFGIFLLARSVLTPRNWWTHMNGIAGPVVPPFASLATVSLVIALVWLAGQVVLVVISDRVRSGSGNPTATALTDRGYLHVLRACARGEFGISCARWLTGLRWGSVILAGAWLLFRSDALHQPEEDLLLPLGGAGETAGPSHSVLVSLTTGDNNPREYLRTAIEINSLFRSGGAAVVCIPRSGVLDSTTRSLIDSLETAGAVVFDRERFDPRSAGIRTGLQRLRFWSAGYGPTGTLPLIHPSVRAAARYLHVPVQLPADYKRMSVLPWYGGSGGGPDRSGGEVMLGSTPIPRWSDGWSVVPYPRGLFPMQQRGGTEQWNSFIFRVGLLRAGWHTPIEFMFYGDAHRVRTLPDSILRLVSGRMVFIDWSDMGDGDLRGSSAGPAMIAEMLVRGEFIREAPAWHILMTGVVIMFGIALFVWSRPSVILLLLLASALAIGAADVWIFKEQFLVTRLIYPAFVALVTAVVFPLVRLAERT